MNDPVIMRGLERFRDLPRDRECFIERDRAARDPLCEVFRSGSEICRYHATTSKCRVERTTSQKSREQKIRSRGKAGHNHTSVR